MKKVLFTLATLFASMTMFAQGQATPFCGVAPVIVFGDADGNEISEVTVTPGVDLECSFILKSIADEVYVVSGFQTQWKMFDANHADINYDNGAGIVQLAKVYGGRVKSWLNPVRCISGQRDSLCQRIPCNGYEHQVQPCVLP